MALPYGPPGEVSPLIRGLRFGLLFAGILYAFGKQKIYDRLEAARLEEEARKKVIRDKQIAILKKKIAKEEKEAVRQLETGELFKTDEEKAAESHREGSPCSKKAEPNLGPCPSTYQDPNVKMDPCPAKVADDVIKTKPCPKRKL